MTAVDESLTPSAQRKLAVLQSQSFDVRCDPERNTPLWVFQVEHSDGLGEVEGLVVEWGVTPGCPGE